jgi:hypothetical protein
MSFGDDRVVASMAVTPAGSAFFFDVRNFPAGRYLTIFSNDAATGERGETEKSNETIHGGAPSSTTDSNCCAEDFSVVNRLACPLLNIGLSTASV